ncbi:alginate lyase-domain-containing protein [Jimgerdemannia flammicorona]|uniref:Alginate lyase-domain-containing protein n=1 Tax=Jimgerdemannia flammicorona TaxID=994334 RepID=A0A433QGX7_9FUNG|nr:alginate lyase-domain-containing protein [Jimgerdemannia flammicorona]
MLSGIEIIKASKHWDKKTNSDLQKWFKKYSVWFETSPMGRKEGEGVNNHGTYYKAQLAAFSRFVGDDAKVKKILQSYITPMFDLQFNASGAQPYELRRVFSTRYSFFNLQGVMYLAKLGQSYGIDLWRHKNKSGAGIQTAVDFLIPLALNPKDDQSPAGLLPLLEDAENIYGGKKKYGNAIKKIRELTNGGDSLAEWILWNPEW